MADVTGWLRIDLANVWNKPKGPGSRVISTLAWGDEVTVTGKEQGAFRVRLRLLSTGTGPAALSDVTGYIRAGRITQAQLIETDRSASRVLRIDFVDVQQGDAAVVETPGGAVMLIDGGDNQLFARYLASRFRGSSAANPKDIACIVVTHGDADHFAGLAEIQASEAYTGGSAARKRLFINPAAVYHNGLVKGPSTAGGRRASETTLLGTTRKDASGVLHVTRLVNDPREVPRDKMNQPFQEWADALNAWDARRQSLGQPLISIGRLSRTSAAPGGVDPFSVFTAEQIRFEVLGPIESVVAGRPALRFLGEPVPKVDRQPGQSQVLFHGASASHTINGHSLVLRLTYGKLRVLFAGDLNEEAERVLTGDHANGAVDLTSEVFKVPHHGSADFDPAFLKAVSPVVSVISSGDENAQKEYIHPRATLLGALSRQGRPGIEEPLIFVTELAAFFQTEGWVFNDPSRLRPGRQVSKRKGLFFAFRRKAFGIVKVRSDGERMLVYTYSGKDDLKEAYAFRLGDPIAVDAIRKC